MSNSQFKTSIQSGFTLIELMVVVLISAILIAMAAPSFSSLITRSNVDALQSQLSNALSVARTEAASRNKIVTICASNGGAACSTASSDWSYGWIIFEDTDADGAIDTGETTLIDVFSKPPAYTISVTPTTATFVTFNSQGFITAKSPAVPAATLLTVCDPKQDAVYARALFVNLSGLVMKSRDTDNDGKHNNPATPASQLTCP